MKVGLAMFFLKRIHLLTGTDCPDLFICGSSHGAATEVSFGFMMLLLTVDLCLLFILSGSTNIMSCLSVIL